MTTEPFDDLLGRSWHRHLLAASPATTYLLRLDREPPAVLWVSDHVSRALGYKPAEAQAPGFWAEHVHPDDRAVGATFVQRLLAEGQVVVEYRFRHRNGSWRWIRDEARRLPPELGRPAEVVGAWTDITTRLEIEEALRDSEERFRQAFANAPIGMALVGLDERFLEVNRALCAILGRDRDQLLQLTVPEVTHPEDVAAEREQKRLLLAPGRTAYQMEKRYLRADGRVVWGQLSVSAVKDRDGRPRYFIGQLEDISERKRAEDALRASEERFRALIETSRDIVTVFDRDDRIRFATPAVRELLGHAPEEVVGRSALDLLHPDERSELAQALTDLRRRPGESRRLVHRLAHKDGTWRVFETLANSLLHLPAVAGIVIHSRDVTEQRRLEERFHQAQRLESVGRLAGGIAHDFNNLLTAITGYADLLERGLALGRTDPAALGEIRRAAERAGALTNQLLAFARRQVITPGPVDLNVLLANLERMLGRLLGEDVGLAVRLADGLPLVWADRGQLEQVVLNLAVNARDAMPKGGRLHIDTDVGAPGAAAVPSPAGAWPGTWVRLTVADGGVGMSADTLGHVFEPFFTTKPEGKGTGLGLATVYGIVTQAHGCIEVESELDRGSTFRIFLPATQAAAPPPPPAPPPVLERGVETVLVVEDEPAVREVVAACLASAGYRPLVAGSGAEAIELFERLAEPPALVVTDVVMPGMSGKDLAAELVRREPCLKVLFMSGYAEDVIAHEGVLEPGVEFLAKPFQLTVLLDRVRRVLDGA
jgi:PAS domain S-box-containing protein